MVREGGGRGRELEWMGGREGRREVDGRREREREREMCIIIIRPSNSHYTVQVNTTVSRSFGSFGRSCALSIPGQLQFSK